MRARVSMPSPLVLNRLPVVYTDYRGVDALVVVTSRHTHSLLFSRRQALGDVAALSHPENGLHFLRVGIGVSLCTSYTICNIHAILYSQTYQHASASGGLHSRDEQLFLLEVHPRQLHRAEPLFLDLPPSFPTARRHSSARVGTVVRGTLRQKHGKLVARVRRASPWVPRKVPRSKAPNILVTAKRER